MEGGVFVVMANGVMNDVPGFAGGGAAGIYGPDGSLLSAPIDPADEGLAVADLDLDAIDIAKVFADPVGHYARPDVFTFAVDRTARSAATVGAVVEGGFASEPTPSAGETGTADGSPESIPV
jgi:aliphatic nitrilase